MKEVIVKKETFFGQPTGRWLVVHWTKDFNEVLAAYKTKSGALKRAAKERSK